MKHLLQHLSDHTPILISLFRGLGVVRGDRPFRFQAAWLSHEGFEGVLKEAWKSDTPLYPLLGQVPSMLSSWNREVFGNLFFKKRNLWARIEGVQRKISQRPLSHLLSLDANLMADLDVVLNQLEILGGKNPEQRLYEMEMEILATII